MELTREEFHQLFIENQHRVFAYILTVLPRVDDAREVFQSTCLILLNKADQFEPGTSFVKWACQIAHFEVCNYRRRRQREFLVIEDQVLESLLAKQLAQLEQIGNRQEALRLCLDRLPSQDRQLIDARYQRNITARQLARELGRPEDTVYKALRRIRSRLQQCIECIERSLARG
jgi:RNA polymerase sigma-70 factor, ECF subfamily